MLFLLYIKTGKACSVCYYEKEKLRFVRPRIHECRSTRETERTNTEIHRRLKLDQECECERECDYFVISR